MRKCVPWWPVHHWITRAKHAVIMGISSFLLRQGTTLFSDGTGLVSRAGPPPERRSVNTALLKTRNRLAASRRHAHRHLSGAARTVDSATDDGDDAVGFSRRDAVTHQGQRQTPLSSDAVEYCAKAHPRTHGGTASHLYWTRYLILQNQFSFVRNV